MRTESKMIELMGMVGEITSENFSPTLRAKLVSINEYRGVCTMEVVESPYTSMVQGGSLNNDKVGMRYTAPVYRIWNAFFF
jgi:alkyl hydroperoxide reductase subunit AhpF